MNKDNIDSDKVLIFDVKGPFAHFRKYYTNSSSLSYSFPPRTVITGLIGGLLGYPNERTERHDEIYYELFNREKCNVTVSLKTSIRKMMHTVNYLGTDDFPKTAVKMIVKMMGGKIAHTQIPLEILTTEEAFRHDITYRVYFYQTNEDTNKDIYEELKSRLQNQKFVYPPYLGVTEFLARVSYIAEGRLDENHNANIEIKSICRLDDVEPDFEGNNLKYLIEKMPTGFLNDRTPLKPENYIFEMNRCLRVKVKNCARSYSVCYLDKGCSVIENIMFM